MVALIERCKQCSLPKRNRCMCWHSALVAPLHGRQLCRACRLHACMPFQQRACGMSRRLLRATFSFGTGRQMLTAPSPNGFPGCPLQHTKYQGQSMRAIASGPQHRPCAALSCRTSTRRALCVSSSLYVACATANAQNALRNTSNIQA